MFFFNIACRILFEWVVPESWKARAADDLALNPRNQILQMIRSYLEVRKNSVEYFKIA